MSTDLFDLAGEARALLTRLSELDLDEQTVLDTLEAETGDLQVRATNIVAVARSLESAAEAIREQEQRMAQRRQALERRAARIRDYVRDAMQVAGIERISSPWFVVSVRENPPLVVIDDERQVPMLYMREPPAVPDKTAIKAALQAGQDVPGARLDRRKSLQVR